MCWMCDGASYEEVLARMAWIVAEQGWAIQGVERGRIHPPWAYTVGLTLAGLPELVVTGMPLPRAAELLNGVAAQVGTRRSRSRESRCRSSAGRWSSSSSCLIPTPISTRPCSSTARRSARSRPCGRTTAAAGRGNAASGAAAVGSRFSAREPGPTR